MHVHLDSLLWGIFWGIGGSMIVKMAGIKLGDLFELIASYI